MLDDDIEFDDDSCPKCGHYPTYSRRCHVLGCDDGNIDLHEYDDPLFFDPGETEMCTECWGTGWERWCPKCGYDLQKARLTQRAADAGDSAEISSSLPADNLSNSDGGAVPTRRS